MSVRPILRGFCFITIHPMLEALLAAELLQEKDSKRTGCKEDPCEPNRGPCRCRCNDGGIGDRWQLVSPLKTLRRTHPLPPYLDPQRALPSTAAEPPAARKIRRGRVAL